eukprot:COSAG05_NODE_2979_length_2440_cov_6.336181_3_plen_85_part_00
MKIGGACENISKSCGAVETSLPDEGSHFEQSGAGVRRLRNDFTSGCDQGSPSPPRNQATETVDNAAWAVQGVPTGARVGTSLIF